MTDKQINKDCEFFNICKSPSCGTLYDIKMCPCYKLFKQIKRKEQECETLKSENFTFEELIKTQEELINKYKEALDNIEEFGNIYCDTCKEFTPIKQSDIVCRYCQKTQIEKIIKKLKEK